MGEPQVESDAAVAEPDEARQKPETKDRKRPRRQPPYVLIVHNDDNHTFPYVIEVLQRICGHPLARAEQLTEQVHRLGRAVVWTGAREVAELKRDQIRGYGTDFYARVPCKYPLGVTIEPLPQT